MKIIFLNVWDGKISDGIAAFIAEQAPTTDVFCFQEAAEKFVTICQPLLKDFDQLAAAKFVTKNDDFNQVTYVRRSLAQAASGTVLQDAENTGLGLYVQLKTANQDLYICNFHGMSRPGDKLDNTQRLQASRALIDFFSDKPGAKIIGGDFNLSPQAKSVQMFAQHGYQDLIKNFKIPTTRNRLAWDLYPIKMYFSDYVFASPDVRVTNFTVPACEISDHLPLILEFE